MASLSSDANGNRTVQFVGGDGKRRSVRLGKVPKKVGEGVKLRVEALAAAVASKLPLDGETAAWVAGVGDDLAAKLASVGLIPARASRTLSGFLAEYVDGRRADGSKPATVVTVRRVADDLTAALGGGNDLRRVTAEDAERFKAHYQSGLQEGVAAYPQCRR